MKVSHPRQTPGSLRSSSTWKIPCHPISRQTESAGFCGRVHWCERISAAASQSDRGLSANYHSGSLIPTRSTLDLRVWTVFLCSALLTLPSTGAHWAHHPPSTPDSPHPPPRGGREEAGRSRRMRLPLPSHFIPFNIWWCLSAPHALTTRGTNRTFDTPQP